VQSALSPAQQAQQAPRTREKLAEMDTPAPTPGDLFPLELVHLLDTARHVIDQHVNDNGTCAECASIWPCQRARLAESALAAI
jgi:hypothetical protein